MAQSTTAVVTDVTDYEYYDDSGWPLYIRVPIGVLVSIVGVVNIVGNTCTIVAFGRDRKLRTVANHYIMNLAITDLIVGINSVPFYAVYTVLDFYWPFGYAFCKVWCVIDFWVCAESSLTIILISYDRLSMVRRGAQYLQMETSQKALVRIAVTWLVSFLLYCPAIVGYNYWRGYSTVEEGDCDVEFATDFWYTVITSVLEFLVPFLLITVFNLMLYMNIRRRSRRVAAADTSIKAPPPPDKVVAFKKPQQEKPKPADSTIRRDKKAARNLTVLVVVYFVCWLPYVVSTVIKAVCDHCVGDDLYEFFNWLLWLNSSLNAFMYAFTNERFRANYRKMFCCLCDRYGYPDTKARPDDVNALTKPAKEPTSYTTAG